MDKFLENEIDMEVFKTLSEKRLKALLEEIDLKLGAQMKIISKREAILENRGMLKKDENCIYIRTTLYVKYDNNIQLKTVYRISFLICISLAVS